MFPNNSNSGNGGHGHKLVHAALDHIEGILGDALHQARSSMPPTLEGQPPGQHHPDGPPSMKATPPHQLAEPGEEPGEGDNEEYDGHDQPGGHTGHPFNQHDQHGGNNYHSGISRKRNDGGINAFKKILGR